MTAVPPLLVPTDQVNPIFEAVVTNRLFAKDRGGSGLVKIIAPFPAIEGAELPT